MFETTDDLEIFLDDFGVDCVFTLKNLASTLTVSGIFDNAFYNPMLKIHEFETTEPQINCITSQIADVAKGDTVLIENTTYKVLQKQQDGTGMSTVKLSIYER